MKKHYDWIVIETSPSGRERRRRLGCPMSRSEARAWAVAHPGKRLEIAPASEAANDPGGGAEKERNAR